MGFFKNKQQKQEEKKETTETKKVEPTFEDFLKWKKEQDNKITALVLNFKI